MCVRVRERRRLCIFQRAAASAIMSYTVVGNPARSTNLSSALHNMQFLVVSKSLYYNGNRATSKDLKQEGLMKNRVETVFDSGSGA